MSFRHVFSLVLVFGFVIDVHAAEPDPELVYAETTLKEAKVETDGPALLRFFRERTLTDADRARLPDAVRRLGDDDFETREKAGEELLRAGRKALPFLRPALHDKDPERARRASLCVEEIDSKRDLTLAAAVARLLEERRPPETSTTLLDYLPVNDDEVVEAAVLRALVAVALKDGNADPVLVRSLMDKEPRRRAAAAHALGRAAPGQRESVRRLLADDEPRVRFEAADALVRAGDKAAVPVLVSLLGEGPLPLGWRAQEILYRLAGDKAPALALSDKEPAKRARVADAWRGWWKDAAGSIDVGKINLEETLQGVNVVCEIPPVESNGRVWACRADGKAIWEIKGIPAPVDVHLLPNGHVLVAEWQTTQVTERDHTGAILWTKKMNNSLTTCRRLPNGNTFIATVSEVTEVDPKGVPLYTYKDALGGSIYRAHRLPNGHILYASGGRIVELDAGGKEVRKVMIPMAANDWTSVEPLPGGRYLVAVRGANKVMELDAAGKVVWECNTSNPMSAVRLPNGNTLVACYIMGGNAIEYDRAGKPVWTLKVDTKAFCVRRY